MPLTCDQKKIVEKLDHPLFVAAGAGSGKTFTLTQRVVHALKPGSKTADKAYLNSLDEVLIITFTEKAAQEIKERVRAALRKEGLEDQALLVDNSWISTIHGMCSRMLKQHALSLGIDPAFSILTGLQSQSIQDEILEEVLKELKDDEAYQPLFSSYKLESLAANEQSIRQMIELLNSQAGMTPGGLSAINFAGRGANYTALLSDLLSCYQSIDVTACGGKEDEREAEVAKVEEAKKLLQDLLGSKLKVSAQEANKIFSQLTNSKYKLNGRKWSKKSVKDVTSALNQELGYLEAVIDCELAHPHAQLLVEIAHKINERYKQKKKELGALDQNDLLYLADEMMQREDIAQQYAHKFKLVMVDEFQDTDYRQLSIINKLSGENGEHLCTVGDVQQSIYKFRGADVSVFNSRSAESGIETITLGKNFRSHDDILRFVAKTCNHTAMMENFADLEAGRLEAPEVEPAYRKTRVYVELTKTVKSGKSVPKFRLETQAYQIATRLKELRDQGVQPRDIALLMGRLSNASVFVNAIRSVGLPCVVTGGSTFAQSEEVLAVQALLFALVNPHDTQRGLYPLLTSEIFGLDAQDLTVLGSKWSDGVSLHDKQPIDVGFMRLAEIDPQYVSKRLKKAYDVMQKAWKELSVNSLVHVLRHVIERSGWLVRLEKQSEEGMVKTANILGALHIIKQVMQEEDLGIASVANAFASWLNVAKQSPMNLVGEGFNAVQVMTVHASKGLEFPVVAVAECWNSKDASKALICSSQDGATYAALRKSKMSAALKSIDFGPVSEDSVYAAWYKQLAQFESDANFAEKIRLIYVALTRARESLIVSLEDLTAKTKQSLTLTDRILMALASLDPQDSASSFESDPQAEKLLDFGGSLPAYVRTVELSLNNEKATTAHTLAALQADLDVYLAGSATTSDQNAVSGSFDLYECVELPEPKLVCLPKLRDSFSYSSLRAKHEMRQLDITDHGIVDEDADDTSAVTKDENFDTSERAVNLGSAFHEAAEYMVNTGREASEDLALRMAELWDCSVRQTERLKKALTTWSNSKVRQEALSFSYHRPEVPFYIEAQCEEGKYLEGAIDLLSYNADSETAYVYDYKTGDTFRSDDEIFVLHEHQAKLYAHVMFKQGFKKVVCTFICVEIPDETGEPKTVIYEYNDPQEVTFDTWF